jgi:transcriptional regulator with XRE-family HTH domain
MQYTLKELRARKCWTQKETAERLGISVQTYNAWEKDISRIAVGKVLVLADVLGVKLSEIKIKNDDDTDSE